MTQNDALDYVACMLAYKTVSELKAAQQNPSRKEMAVIEVRRNRNIAEALGIYPDYVKKIEIADQVVKG